MFSVIFVRRFLVTAVVLATSLSLWPAGAVAVEFPKVVGEPMDVVVSERLMARGEVVVVNENYGVRISEVTRPDEKIGERRD